MIVILILLCSLNSLSAENFFDKANKYFKEGKFEMALIYYQKTLQDNPENGDAYFNIAKIYYAKDDYKNALLNFQKADELKPNLKENIRGIASVYAKLKEPDKAIEYFQKLIKLDKNYANAYLDIGNVYLQQLSNKEKTIENWEIFLDLAPTDEQAEKIRRALAYLKDPNFVMPKPGEQLTETTAASNGLSLPKLSIEGKDLKAPSEEKSDTKKRKGIVTE